MKTEAGRVVTAKLQGRTISQAEIEKQVKQSRLALGRRGQ
jgi:hypothetical protein